MKYFLVVEPDELLYFRQQWANRLRMFLVVNIAIDYEEQVLLVTNPHRFIQCRSKLTIVLLHTITDSVVDVLCSIINVRSLYIHFW